MLVSFAACEQMKIVCRFTEFALLTCPPLVLRS